MASTELSNQQHLLPLLAVHGGAWSVPDNLSAASMDGVKEAAMSGYKLLEAGFSAVETVEAVVSKLEDNPIFDAGTGSALNVLGEVEMDAMIMDGSTLNSGAVACVQNIANPIQLAKHVMEKTEHVLIVGNGANAFAEEMGIPKIPADKLVTEDAKKYWQKYHDFKATTGDLFHASKYTHGHETVGCVARDKFGNVACGTSTGGIPAQRQGRVGDSPIIGAGGYADNKIGAVSTTGHGEAIAKVCLAKYIITQMENGFSEELAIKKGLEHMFARLQSCGGAIVLNKSGSAAAHFTTERMSWAWRDDHSLHYGLNPGEHDIQKIL